MAKFYGEVGYSISTEVRPTIWKDVIIPYNYSGDVIQNTRSVQSTDQVNDNITVADKISILADPFARANYLFMKYVKYMGIKWKVTKIEVLYPRLILTLGEVYNG